MNFTKDKASGITVRSNDSPAAERFLNTLGAVILEASQQQRYCLEWLRGFRRLKAIYPDDGWVDREKNKVYLSYPNFNANPESDSSYQAPDGLIKFYFDEENGGCGCNLSRSIHYYADVSHPILDCGGGENIEVVSIERVPVPDDLKALHDGITCDDPECSW